MYIHHSLNESLGNLKVITDSSFSVILKALMKARYKHSIGQNSQVIESKGTGADAFLADVKNSSKFGTARVIFIETPSFRKAYYNMPPAQALKASTVLVQLDIDERKSLVTGGSMKIRVEDKKNPGQTKEVKRNITVARIADAIIDEDEYKAVFIFDDIEAYNKSEERSRVRRDIDGEYASPWGQTHFMDKAKQTVHFIKKLKPTKLSNKMSETPIETLAKNAKPNNLVLFGGLIGRLIIDNTEVNGKEKIGEFLEWSELVGSIDLEVPAYDVFADTTRDKYTLVPSKPRRISKSFNF